MGCSLQQYSAHCLQQHLVSQKTHHQIAEWHPNYEQIRVQGIAQVWRVQQEDVASLITIYIPR
jgi:hypothetical protein